jgi:hypothetical protein
VYDKDAGAMGIVHEASLKPLMLPPGPTLDMRVFGGTFVTKVHPMPLTRK